MPGDDSSANDSANRSPSLDSLFEPSEAVEESADDAEPPAWSNKNWLSTGIESLDRYLGGGIPPGRLVAFEAPANTQAELFVKQVASQYDSLYLTTLRPRWEVEEAVRDYIQRAGNLATNRIDTRVEYLNPESLLKEAHQHIDRLDGRSVVVVDSVDKIETAAEADYVDFITELKKQLWETGSVGLLHCIERTNQPPGRPITLQMSDIILELHRSVQPGSVEYRLLVAKYRGGRALTEPVKLELTDEIRIDTSRDIA